MRGGTKRHLLVVLDSRLVASVRLPEQENAGVPLSLLLRTEGAIQPMATETITRLVDDLDGSKADRTVIFVWDGQTYSIDLSKKNIAALEKALQPYIAAARTVRASRPTKATRKRNITSSGDRTGQSIASRAIREWARSNGYEVSDRGRIRADIMMAYESAN